MKRQGLRCAPAILAAVALLSVPIPAPAGSGRPGGVPPARLTGGGSSSVYAYPNVYWATPASSGIVPPVAAAAAQPSFRSFYAPPALDSSSAADQVPFQITLSAEAKKAANGDPAAASFEMRVPANAEIWIEGEKSQQIGTVRLFNTPPLESCKSYAYNIRVRWVGAGNTLFDTTRSIIVQPGRETIVVVNDR